MDVTNVARHDIRAHLRDPLYRTGYLLISGAAVSSLLGFVFWVLAAREYPAQVVGVSSALISAMMLASGVCTLGLNAVLMRYLPSAGSDARGLVTWTYALTVALSIVLGAGAALTSGLWSTELGFVADDSAWLVGFTVATALWTIFALQDSVLTGLQAPHWVPIENSLFALAKILLLVLLAESLPTSGPFVAWNAPVLVPIVLVSLLIFRRLLPRHEDSGAPSSLDRRQLLRTSVGNYGGTLFSLATTLLMPILVANALGTAQTAYFYVPWTIVIGLQLIALNMSISFTVEGALNTTQLGELCRRVLTQTMRMLIPVAVLLAIAAPYVLRVFGNQYADEGTALLRLLIAGAIPNVLVLIGLSVARIEHRGRALLLTQAAQCVLVLGLSALLMVPVGIQGVGIAWVAGQSILAAVLAFGPLRGLLRPQTAPSQSRP